jgi:hypothetical protein
MAEDHQMIKAIAIFGQLGGCVSSVLLALGYAPTKGTMTWTTGDGSEFRKNEKRKAWMLPAGYWILAISFLIGAGVTFMQ